MLYTLATHVDSTHFIFAYGNNYFRNIIYIRVFIYCSIIRAAIKKPVTSKTLMLVYGHVRTCG